jgi:restriction endonuclease Mrr
MNEVISGLPRISELIEPTLNCLRANNGQAHFKTIEEWVVKELGLSVEQRNLLRTGNRTELQYRLSWARTKAKSEGVIENHGKGFWILIK